MADLSLESNAASQNYGDLKLSETGDFILTSGSEAVAQDLMQRLQFFLGEWFLDVTLGIPYFEQIFVKNPNLPNLEALLINQILSTPGVIRLNSFTLDPDFSLRNLKVQFQLLSTSGMVSYEGVLSNG